MRGCEGDQGGWNGGVGLDIEAVRIRGSGIYDWGLLAPGESDGKQKEHCASAKLTWGDIWIDIWIDNWTSAQSFHGLA